MHYLWVIINTWTFAKTVVMRNVRFAMPTINLDGFNTQVAPMKAVDEVLRDYYEGCVSAREAMEYINAINCEWKF